MAVILSLVFFLCGYSDELSLEDILALHQQYVDRFHTAEAEIESWISDDDGASWRLLARDEWWRDGLEERGRRWTAAFFDKSQRIDVKEQFMDQSFSDGKVLSLMGWDPSKSHPEAASPANHYLGARGSLAEASSESTSMGGPVLLLLRGPMVDALSSAVRSAHSARLVRKKSEDHDLWTVELETAVPFPYTLRFTMDPSRDFAPVERIMTFGSEGHLEWKVLDYRREKGDLWVPSRVQMLKPDRPGQRIEYRLTKLRLNQPVDRSLLRVPIPEGMLVASASPGPLYIWGKDGPRLTFANGDELQAYEMASHRRSEWSTALWAGLLTAMFAVIGFLLVLWRRRLRLTTTA
jgi:hypothetical protein